MNAHSLLEGRMAMRYGLLAVAAMCLIGCAQGSGRMERVATLAAAGAATRPAEGVGKQTFVLVHGAWAGGWEWKPCGDLLLAHGHTVYRPTLTGQGEREHLASPAIDVNTHIQDVVNMILFEDLHDIVLVGHSYGGMVVTGVADRVPERIKCLIYVDAHVPVDGESSNTIRQGGARQEVDGFIPLTPAPRADRKPPYIVKMPAKTFSTPVSLKNQAAALKIPTAYILTVVRGQTPEQDGFFKSYARARERGWAVSVMPGDHVVHINQTANLVERLEKATLEAKGGK
jgi:pimeloyl-ACP methyl ester carboxylesterase